MEVVLSHKNQHASVCNSKQANKQKLTNKQTICNVCKANILNNYAQNVDVPLKGKRHNLTYFQLNAVSINQVSSPIQLNPLGIQTYQYNLMIQMLPVIIVGDLLHPCRIILYVSPLDYINTKDSWWTELV